MTYYCSGDPIAVNDAHPVAGHANGQTHQDSASEVCRNKSCARRSTLEEKLVIHAEKIKADFEEKLKSVHKLQRQVSAQMSAACQQ